MNNALRIAAAAAVVLVVAYLGIRFLPSSGTGGPPEPTTTPSPIPSPSPTAIDYTDYPGGGEALNPGPYVITAVSPFRITFTVPSGWYKGVVDHAVWYDATNASVGFGKVNNLYVDPCAISLGLQDPAVGPTVDDLATALSNLPGVEAPAPTDVTVGGFAGKQLDLTGSAAWQSCDGPNNEPLLTPSGIEGTPGTDGQFRVWILDVGGNRLVIVGNDWPDSSWADGSPNQALLDSIQIDVP